LLKKREFFKERKGLRRDFGFSHGRSDALDENDDDDDDILLMRDVSSPKII